MIPTTSYPMKEDVKKKILPPPLAGDVDVVTCIQPRLLPKGGFWFGRFGSPRLPAASQPQLLVPTRRFHEAVALDAIRLPKLRKQSVDLSANHDPM
jgi:hypothetical protein